MFSTIDYAIFGVFILISLSVGVFYAWRERYAKNVMENYLMGGRRMPVLPTALSLLTSYISAVSLLGTPAEIYEKGLLFWVRYLAGIPAFITAAVFFLPVLHPLKLTSIYEYFELRYNSRLLRRLASAIFVVSTLFFMAVVLYGPSVALAGVISGIETWHFILVVGVSCTVYTTIGGLKAVVWTDTLQAVFMYTGIITLVVKGTIDAGGTAKVLRILEESGRTRDLLYLSPNPAQYNSVWISLFGGAALWLAIYGLSQISLQRYSSLPSLGHAIAVVGVTAPAFAVLSLFTCSIGVVMLATFYDCDPMMTGRVHTKDQLVILFAERVLGVLPGFPGLFLACLFSTTLSTVSSGINAMAAVTWEDFLKFHPRIAASDVRKQMYINKLLVLIYGMLSTALAFSAGPLGGIIQVALSIGGATLGPLLGLFFLGVLVPSSNRPGALAGLSTAVLVSVGICIGAFVGRPYAGHRLSNENTCDQLGNKTYSIPTEYDSHYGRPDVFYPFRFSPFLYPLVGITICLVVGVIVSYSAELFFGFQSKPPSATDQPTRRLCYFGRSDVVCEVERPKIEMTRRITEPFVWEKGVAVLSDNNLLQASSIIPTWSGDNTKMTPAHVLAVTPV